MDNDTREKIYDKGWWAAIDMVIDVITEMQAKGDFHNPTLDELEQRIS